ncbi:bioC [Symbiodinium sp. KB8]|nr:bioC [Symbiodinium sp. KB8]
MFRAIAAMQLEQGLEFDDEFPLDDHFEGHGGSLGSSVKRTICKFWEEGACKNGATCTWAHGAEELGMPLSPRLEEMGPNAKKTLCKFWLQGTCTKGSSCTFAHGDQELVSTAPVSTLWQGLMQRRSAAVSTAPLQGSWRAPSAGVSSKRTICKFWEQGLCTKGDNCTFAHGEEEIGAPLVAIENIQRAEPIRPVKVTGPAVPFGGADAVVAGGNTKRTICRFWEQGTCTRGDCTWAHGEEELGAPVLDRATARQGDGFAIKGKGRGREEPPRHSHWAEPGSSHFGVSKVFTSAFQALPSPAVEMNRGQTGTAPSSKSVVAASRTEVKCKGWNGGKGVAEQPLKKTICKFWLEGQCSRGETCTWAHGEEDRVSVERCFCAADRLYSNRCNVPWSEPWKTGLSVPGVRFEVGAEEGAAVQGQGWAHLRHLRHLTRRKPRHKRAFLELAELLQRRLRHTQSDALRGEAAAACKRHLEIAEERRLRTPGLTERSLRIDLAKHLLAVIQRRTPAEIASSYVVSLFDHYAASFDASLESLGYQVPQLLVQAKVVSKTKRPEADAERPLCSVQAIRWSQEGWARREPCLRRMLDLGAGTGLLGEQLRDLAPRAHLVAVDLSAQMLQKAQAKGCYDELHCSEITHYLTAYEGSDPFDLVAAADVFGYVTDLSAVFRLVLQNLSPERGLFVFSTEEPADECPGYQLEGSGRIAHSHAYILSLAQRCSFQVIRDMRCELRNESGYPVNGHVFSLMAQGLPENQDRMETLPQQSPPALKGGMKVLPPWKGGALVQTTEVANVRRSICKFWEQGKCSQEAGQCTWAHGEWEIGTVPGRDGKLRGSNFQAAKRPRLA